MSLPILRLKKNEERRIRAGHLWVYSNEIDNALTPLKDLLPGTEVQLVAYDKTPLGIGYVNPHSLIAVRLCSRKLTDRLNLDFFVTRMQIALRLREQLYAQPFYRLLFSEGDGLPGLIVDRFGDILVAQLNTAGMDVRQELIVTALCTVLPKTQAILWRNDSSSRLQEGLTTTITSALGTPPKHVLLEENNTQFHAPIWDGQKTGWFYDHRLNRTRLADYVKDKKVLDVFSYLGAWGIQAIKSGARETLCIDASAAAVAAISANATLNGIESQVDTDCDDAFDTLKKLSETQQSFDVIILDPPAFAKKQKDKKSGLLAYQRINELALKILRPEGILISCSCSMQISPIEFTQTIHRASLNAKCRLQILERGHQAPDHPVHPAILETDYLKMLIGRKLDR